MNMHVISWHLIKAAERIGILGIVGLCLLLLSLIFYQFQSQPLVHENYLQSVLLSELEQKKNDQSQIAIAPLPSVNMAGEVDRFYARFPNTQSLPSLLEQIDAEALRQSLKLDRGDYKLNKVKTAKFSNAKHAIARYEIIFPLTGHYQQIRKFVNLMLAKMPMLAVSDIHISRDTINSTSVEARLILVLFLQDETV